MNGKTLKLVVLTASIVLAVFFGFGEKKATALLTGPDPGFTGAPGDFGTCTSCHSGGPTGGVLAIEGLPATYTAGQQINVTVRLTQAARARFGFQLTALGSNGQSAGTIELIEPQRTQLKNSVSGAQRVYIEHTQAGTASVEWSRFMDVQMDSASNQYRHCDILRRWQRRQRQQFSRW